jgi:hypothetical protein
MALTVLIIFIVSLVISAITIAFKVAGGLMWTIVIIAALIGITQYIIKTFNIQDGE